MSKVTRYIVMYLVTFVTVCAYSVAGSYFNNNDTLWNVTPDQQALMSQSLSNANNAASAYSNYRVIK